MQIWRWVKTNWLASLLLGCAVAIFTAVIFKQLTPPAVTAPSPELITNPSVLSSFAQLHYDGEPPRTPDTLSVVQLSRLPISQQEIEEQLILDFSLEPVPGIDGVWTSGNFSLSRSSDNEYVLTKAYPPIPQNSITQQGAITTAQQFLNRYFNNPPVVPVIADIQYLAGDHELEQTSRQTAQLAVVPFTYAVQEYPLLYGDSQAYPFHLTVTAGDQVIKVMFQPIFISSKPTATFPTLTIEQALTNLEDGKGVIISAARDEVGPLSLSSITTGTLSRAEIQYRTDDHLEYAYPYYRFEGEVENELGQTFTAVIITPAIPTE